MLTNGSFFVGLRILKKKGTLRLQVPREQDGKTRLSVSTLEKGAEALSATFTSPNGQKITQRILPSEEHTLNAEDGLHRIAGENRAIKKQTSGQRNKVEMAD